MLIVVYQRYRKLAAAFCLLLSAAFSWSAATVAHAQLPGEGRIVTPARASWNSGWFHLEVYLEALQRLGFDVKRPATMDNAEFYEAVTRGTVDFWVNGWFPLHNSFRREFRSGAVVTGYVAEGAALQGYLIDRTTAQKLGITNLSDFKRSDVRQHFDKDGNGKAELIACPPGWGCNKVINHHLDAYFLRDYVEAIESDYQTAMTDAIRDYEAGTPIFFYTWTPNWTAGLLKTGEDVLWIEVPFVSLPKDQEHYKNASVIEDLMGCANPVCRIGWPVNDIRPVANRNFLIANPAVWRLLQILSIPFDDILEQNVKMFQGESEEEDIIRHAEEWVRANQSRFDSWISEAKYADRCARLLNRAFGRQDTETWADICIRN
jgi:glycine betaine/proline transport system substrate-binding protein